MRLQLPGLMALLVVGLASGCSATRGQPFDASLVDHQFYLCCDTRFNPDREAGDSNYGSYIYSQGYGTRGPMLAAGTLVRVTKVGAAGVALQSPDGQTYTIAFSYGRKQETAEQYFRKILLPTNPMASIGHVPQNIAAAINLGRLVVGMTKEQALIARGYPPAHRTPTLDSNEWIYYETPGVVDRVSFVDGKIQRVRRGQTPD